MGKFPQHPFDLGKTGGDWVKGTRKTGPASFKKGSTKKGGKKEK